MQLHQYSNQCSFKITSRCFNYLWLCTINTGPVLWIKLHCKFESEEQLFISICLFISVILFIYLFYCSGCSSCCLPDFFFFFHLFLMTPRVLEDNCSSTGPNSNKTLRECAWSDVNQAMFKKRKKTVIICCCFFMSSLFFLLTVEYLKDY